MEGWIVVTGVVVVYLIVVLAVGLRASKGESATLEGYVAGGRNVGIVVLFFILGAEIFSSFTFLGAPGAAYKTGVPALYILAYLSLALVMWWFIGPRIAALGRRYGYISQAGLISDRFQSKGMSITMAIMSVLALVPYLTIQITGVGLLFSFATEGKVPFWLGSLLAFGVVTAYVFASGLKGIGWTNLLQGVLMIVVAWVLGLTIVYQLFGSPGEMFTQIEVQYPEFLSMPGAGAAWTWTKFGSAILLSVLGFIMWPHVFMKSYSADSSKSIKRTVVFYPLYALLVIPILFIGFAGILGVGPGELERPDQILLQMAVYVANFHPVVLGIMLAGAIAAAMSTGANLAHTAASIVVKDLVLPLRERLADRSAVRLSRWMVVLISLMAYVFSLINSATLVELFLMSYGIVVQFLPLTYATLYWKRANRAGAFAGTAAGLAVMVFFHFAKITDIEPGIMGLIANTVVLIAVSLATPPMPEAHTSKFTATSDELDAITAGIAPSDASSAAEEQTSTSGGPTGQQQQRPAPMEG